MAEHEAPPERQDKDRDVLRFVTAVLVALMVLGGISQGVYLVAYVQGQRAVLECQTVAFAELNRSLAASREIARHDRLEFRDLLTSLTDQSRPQQERRAALDNYIAAINEAEEQRARNPLPNRTCSPP